MIVGGACSLWTKPPAHVSTGHRFHVCKMRHTEIAVLEGRYCTRLLCQAISPAGSSARSDTAMEIKKNSLKRVIPASVS